MELYFQLVHTHQLIEGGENAPISSSQGPAPWAVSAPCARCGEGSLGCLSHALVSNSSVLAAVAATRAFEMAKVVKSWQETPEARAEPEEELPLPMARPGLEK